MTRAARVLALVTDAYGGNGGIAAYARDSIAAMAGDPRVGEVVVVPRVGATRDHVIPDRVTVEHRAARGNAAYLATLARLAATRRFDAVWVNHVNVAPFGWAMARRSGARMGLVLHGIEAWAASPRRAVRNAATRADLLLPVSRVTLSRFRAAYDEQDIPALVSPGAVDLDRFVAGDRPHWLAERLGLGPVWRHTMFGLGRLDPREGDAKGFGRVIAALPALATRWPDIVFVIGGEGGLRETLEARAASLGMADHVRFAGRIADSDLADYYRLADVYVMPSTGEGLGLVFLEALACGTPVIAGSGDGGAEAVAGMGRAVDPNDPVALEEALALSFEQQGRPHGIVRFGREAMAGRVSDALTRLLPAMQ